MTRLSVNLNKIALLRNSRGGKEPGVLAFAHAAIAAGAHGITVHPRPDGRHVLHNDVRDLKAAIGVELNVEGNPAPELLDLVLDVRPAQCTLVPDDPGQLTSDHGWDLERQGERLQPIVDTLHDAGIRVSLFMDPAPEPMALARDVGADRIELYTESYAAAFGTDRQDSVLDAFVASARAARDAGLELNAGHDLNQANLATLLDAIPDVEEVSIGHALICEALWGGFESTVRRYVEIVSQERAATRK